MDIQIIKKPSDGICTRAAMGGNDRMGYYVVYRGELKDVLTVFERCLPAVKAAIEAEKRPVMTCKRCGASANNQVLTPDEPHYGKVVCVACGGFLAWLPRPVLPLNKEKLPKPLEPGAPLPALTGQSDAQVKLGEHCRAMLLARQHDLSPELFEAMLTITDVRFWIANKDKATAQIRWPAEWS